MASRLKLQSEFVEVLETTPEDSRVYFNPPQKLAMKYPCIRYSLSGIDTQRANDTLYNYTNKYDGVVIDKNPESPLPLKILERFPMCSFGKPYVAENLNHFPFTLYY